MSRKRSLTLQEAQQADVDEGVAPWGKPDALRAASVRWMRRMKHLTKVLTVATGLITAVAGTVATVSGYAAKVWRLVTLRRPAPAELLKTGNPTVATDFVAEPQSAPDGSGRKP